MLTECLEPARDRRQKIVQLPLNAANRGCKMRILAELPICTQLLDIANHTDQLRGQDVDMFLIVGKRQIDIREIVEKFGNLCHVNLQSVGEPDQVVAGQFGIRVSE